MRRLIRTLVVLGVLFAVLAVVDQVARRVAESQLAQRAQTAQRLSARPAVSLTGWPFLTQVISGHYAGGTVTAHSLTVRSLRVDRLEVDLTGVHEPLSDVVRKDISSATADTVTGTVRLTFAALAQASGVRGLTLSGSAGRLTVRRTVTVLGVAVAVRVSARLAVQGGSLTAVDVRADTGPVSIPRSVVDSAFAEVLSAIKPGALPYGLQLSGVRVTSSGVDLTAQGENVSVAR